MAQRLREVTAERRRQLLMQEQHVGAVDIFKNAVRAHGDRLTLLSSPQLGGLTVPRAHAILLEQGLADLLKNVVEHAGGSVELGFSVEDTTMSLNVRDFGPGLGQEEFAPPGSKLRQLQEKLRHHGGDLLLTEPQPDDGAEVRLVLPLQPKR
ncbi:hypothetical protein ABZ345_36215 [Lentzea sp. NPDC005914]|uniref:hypothetical protein n=1 Tax=Lentzea sp. NPDC005914 TaxID=3154572 RepID=UPI0033F7289E